MVKVKRGWHNPVKYVEPSTEGRCSYCHKHVDNLEHHIHDMHKGQKSVKK